MTMLSLLLTFSFVALPQDPPEAGSEQEPEVEIELEEEVELTPEEATDLLKTALKSKQIDLIFIAIEDAGRVAHKNVIKELGKAVKYKDAEVRLEALIALRYNEDPTAFKELLKFKKSKPVLENELCAEAYFYALGQKGDPKAIKVLIDGLLATNRGDKATRARILSLGHIRDVDSVEALISVMNSGRSRRSHPQMREISLSLQVLTGADLNKRDDWQAWWNDNKKSLKLTKQEQEASTRKARAAWMTLWADPEEAELMKEALKKGKDEFGNADSEELERLLEKARQRKERAKDSGDDDGDGEKDDGADKDDGAKDGN